MSVNDTKIEAKQEVQIDMAKFNDYAREMRAGRFYQLKAELAQVRDELYRVGAIERTAVKLMRVSMEQWFMPMDATDIEGRADALDDVLRKSATEQEIEEALASLLADYSGADTFLEIACKTADALDVLDSANVQRVMRCGKNGDEECAYDLGYGPDSLGTLFAKTLEMRYRLARNAKIYESPAALKDATNMYRVISVCFSAMIDEAISEDADNGNAVSVKTAALMSAERSCETMLDGARHAEAADDPESAWTQYNARVEAMIAKCAIANAMRLCPSALDELVFWYRSAQRDSGIESGEKENA